MTTQEIIQMVHDAGYIVEDETRQFSTGHLGLTIVKDGNKQMLGLDPSITPDAMLTTLQWMEAKAAARS